MKLAKKILIISALDVWSMGKNKGAPSLWYTLEGYAYSGWKVFFLTGNKDKNLIYDLHRNIEIIRFDWPRLKRFFNIKKIGFIASSIWWLYFQIQAFFLGFKITKKEKIDIFYGYEIHGVPPSYILGKIFRKPTISRFQGTILAPYTNTFLWKWRYFNHVIALKIPSDLVIMTNDGTQADKVFRKLNVKMSKVKFWVNGVAKKPFDPNFNKDRFKEILYIGKDDKILLVVSRLTRWKRVDRIIKVIPEVIKEYPQIKLLIIGDGVERKNLENEVKELGIVNYVKFLGALPHQRLKDYYNLADIFVSMNDISNVGNPLLEAMSCGKCIITLDVGDTNKFIHHNENGILIKINQINDLGKIILELLRDEEKRKELGNNAKIYADKNFWTWEERISAEIFAVNNLLKDIEK